MSEAFVSLFPGQPLPFVPPLDEPARASKRTRARNQDGEFRADDPATPDVNEAFVAPDAGEH